MEIELESEIKQQTKEELEKEKGKEKENQSEKENKPEEEKETLLEKESPKDSERQNEKESKSEKEKEKEATKEIYNGNKSSDISINISTNIQIKTDKPDKEETDESEKIKSDNIALSFRQINNFEQNIISKIEFDLYTFTIEEKLSKGFEISLYVNLIHIEGSRDEEPTEAKCVLENDIIDNKATASAHFHCSIDNLNERYYSFRYNYSDYITGVPFKEKALDPILTEKAIEINEIKKITEKNELPPLFTIDSMEHNNCKDNGILTFKGNVSNVIPEPIQFNIPLKYPEDISIYCIFTENKFIGEMKCKTDREIVNRNISFEQTVIKEGIEEVLLIASFSSKEQVICENAMFKQSTEKISKTISFRQVSHYKEKTDGFSFYFIILASKGYKKGYELNLEMALDINKRAIKRNATCILNETVFPEDTPLPRMFPISSLSSSYLIKSPLFNSLLLLKFIDNFSFSFFNISNFFFKFSIVFSYFSFSFK